MTTPTPKRKPPAKKIVAGTNRRKPSDTRKKKKDAGPARTAAPKPPQKTGPQNKPRGNDRRALPAPGILSSLSTATEVQLQKLEALLRLRPHHTYELRASGISHPAGRVQNLRDRGHLIETSRIVTVDRDGFRHFNVAHYELVGDPPQLGLDFGRDAANAPMVPKRKGPKQ